MVIGKGSCCWGPGVRNPVPSDQHQVTSSQHQSTMIRNYFKIALRNIKRHSTYSILNISGMAIGMACSILILLWVQDEWSYDRHIRNADNIYRVIENQNPSGGESSLFAVSPGELTIALKEEYPEIIRSSRYEPHTELRLKKGNEFMLEKAVATIDKDFLKMFNIEFVQGDINSALNEPHNVILTEEMAHKYFGNEDALGKTLTEARISGIHGHRCCKEFAA